MNIILACVLAAAISFGISFGLGYVVIPFLHKLKFGQTILDIGPKWHKNKQGTPTMGGILFILGTVIAFAVVVLIDRLMGGDIIASVTGGTADVLPQVAGVAAANGGLSLQQTAAMAEVLGDKALKGSEAGTQLRNIFSKFSAEGIKDADTMMQTLSEHAGDTAYMVKQFGLDSANASGL